MPDIGDYNAPGTVVDFQSVQFRLESLSGKQLVAKVRFTIRHYYSMRLTIDLVIHCFSSGSYFSAISSLSNSGLIDSFDLVFA